MSELHERPLELLWLDPKRAARIRSRPPWRSILDAAFDDPEEPGEPLLPDPSIDAQHRADMLLILARADVTPAARVPALLASSVHEDGKLSPPMVLVSGELRFSFGELDLLKAAMTTATPFAGGDEALTSALAAAKEFLAIPGLSPAPAVVESVTERIREAFRRVKRAVAPGYLEAQSERGLLEQRRYQKKVFRGKPHLRALLHESGDRASLLVVLPEMVADKLPLFTRFGARLIAEAAPSVDQYESHPHVLEAFALAREAPIARRS